MSRASQENLFRRAALQALGEQSLGRTICQVPRAWSWVVVTLTTAFLVAAALAPQIEWHRSESVRGWLVPESGIVRIASPSTGIITERLTDIGQKVEAGDVLATISGELRGADGKSKQDKDREVINAALRALTEREQLLRDQHTLELERAKARARLLVAERDSIVRQIGFEQRRLDIEIRKSEALQSAGDAIPSWELLQAEEGRAGRQSDIENLMQRKARLDRELSLAEAAIDAIPLDAALAHSDVLADQTALQRALGDIDSGFALVAPVAGQVADVSLAVGDIVRSGAELISIVPDGARLHAELHVPSHAAAELERGQAVRLYVDAWPREKFGAIGGTVDHVAEFVGSSETGQAIGTYRVLVRIDDTERPLRAGMSLGAELLLERRDLIDWIIGPLRSRLSS